MNENIKRIYKGLPEKFKYLVLWVARNYRTNPLSHEPGGSDVVVEYHNGSVLGYDWIKFPSKYISTIYFKDVRVEQDEFESYEKEKQLTIIKEEISRIFARKYNKENYENESFKEIWNALTSNDIPWKVLEEYDYKKDDNLSKGNDFLRKLFQGKL